MTDLWGNPVQWWQALVAVPVGFALGVAVSRLKRWRRRR